MSDPKQSEKSTGQQWPHQEPARPAQENSLDGSNRAEGSDAPGSTENAKQGNDASPPAMVGSAAAFGHQAMDSAAGRAPAEPQADPLSGLRGSIAASPLKWLGYAILFGVAVGRF